MTSLAQSFDDDDTDIEFDPEPFLDALLVLHSMPFEHSYRSVYVADLDHRDPLWLEAAHFWAIGHDCVIERDGDMDLMLSQYLED